MNTLAKELSSQKSLQKLLCCLLSHLEKYFRTVGLMSEEKTYSAITKTCSRIHSHSKLSSCHSILTLSRKLIANIETKISDKEDDEKRVDSVSTNTGSVNVSSSKPPSKKKTHHGMKSFINNIASNIDQQEVDNICEVEEALEEPPTRNPSSESEHSWIRKTVLEEIQLLKDDIEEAEETFEENLKQFLGEYRGGIKRHILIMESHLDSQETVRVIAGLGWQPIIIRNRTQSQQAQKRAKAAEKEAEKGKNAKKGSLQQAEFYKTPYISVSQVSSYLHKTYMCMVSSDVITKSGGVISASGSLMATLSCKKYGVPMVAVSRGYCLSDHCVLSQQGLTVGVNPSKVFEIDSDDFGVFLFRSDDFIQSICIDSIVTEQGAWAVENISQIETQYWSY